MSSVRSAAGKAAAYAKYLIKWLALACAVGLTGGALGAVFRAAIEDSTAYRESSVWPLYALPLCGAVIALIYKLLRVEGRGTNDVIHAVNSGERLPAAMGPAIFVSTLLTHFSGGSAGREGAALQIGGGLGSVASRLFRLEGDDTRIITLCGMSAVFSALFGTPVTATFFVLEVADVGVIMTGGMVPCLAASLAAYAVSRLLGQPAAHYALGEVSVSAAGLARVLALAVLCAAASMLFCLVLHHVERYSKKLVKNSVLRAAVGGALVLALTLLLGTTQYNGAGGAVIAAAIERGSAPTLGFMWKLVFTVITIGFGFKGGEIVPCFFMGACLGCAAAPLLGLPAGLAAAVGLVAVFCGAVNCPIASILLSVELFGAGGLLYFASACVLVNLISGTIGLYGAQRFWCSKRSISHTDVEH